MKAKNGILKWILLLAGLVVLTLLLTMCAKSCAAEKPTPVLAEETAAPVQIATSEAHTEAATQPVQETTAPVEETTEPTEETTEPVEETTEATTAPTTSKDEDEDFGEEEPYWEGPDPGTPENPYVEIRGAYPAEVKSVNIPGNTGVSYVISGSAGSVITIQDPNVTLTLDGKTYTADGETGELTVDLSKLGTDPVITLSHSGKSAAACVLTFTEGLGGAGNPEILTDPVELEVTLPEGDADGYHYQWISDITGKVELSLKETESVPEEQEQIPGETEETLPPEEPVLEILVTIGEQTVRLSECEDGKLTFDTVKGQNVDIQLIAQPFRDGTYPAIEETVVWTRLPALGTKENPQPVESCLSIPVKLEKDNAEGWYFQWTPDTYGELTLTPGAAGLDVTATAGDLVASSVEKEEKSVTIHVEQGQPVVIHAAAIPVTGENEELSYPQWSGTITGTLQPDPGTPGNPVVLESPETIPVELEADDLDGVTYRWTAQYGGTLELTVESAQGSFDVILTKEPEINGQKLSETEEETLTLTLEAGETVTIRIVPVAQEDGTAGEVKALLKGIYTAPPGSSPDNPIVIAQDQTAASFAVEARQPTYFSGMVHEMVATLKDASGVSIHCGEQSVWASQSGVAEMTFPAADTEEPVVFSVASRSDKELTITFAYPAGHEKNPAQLTMGTSAVTLEEGDSDGYLLDWTAPCDGLLTIGVDGKNGWQYQLDDMAGSDPGQRFTSSQEPAEPSRTLEVKAGTKLRLTLWTLAAEAEDILPAGTLTVTADFFDPLLGTEAKPIRLDTGVENTVTVSDGEMRYYSAAAEGMILHFGGENVTLIHNGEEHPAEKGSLELVCHGADSLFVITNNSGKEQVCKLRFAYPEGHPENPVSLVMGENRALLLDGSIGGYAFVWTAEGTGLLTVIMTGENGWQYIVRNETAGVSGVVHTSEDQPSVESETLEVTKGDRIYVTVNTFDQTHPLDAPAGEVVFTAEFVDPTLGLEENPVWLNLEDTVTIPAGKTMYCAAKADGMVLVLTGANVTVSHNGLDYSAQKNTVTVPCVGTGTFGHPVFAITNTGAEDAVYAVSFAYPEGHFMNPATLKLGDHSVIPGKCGQYFLWEAKADGLFTFTVNSEDGWRYMISNVTQSQTGEQHSAQENEPVVSETVTVKRGDRLRIMVNTEGGNEAAVSFTVGFEQEIPDTLSEE